jgi:hypothetical protein
MWCARYDPSKVFEGGPRMVVPPKDEVEFFPPGIDRSTIPGPSKEVEQHP